MGDVVTLLSSRRAIRPDDGGGAPRGHDKYSQQQRENIQYYLEARFAVDANESEAEVRRLTVAERVQIEIEMRQARALDHSFEYDPL